MQDVQSFLNAAKGCDIKAVGKLQADIKAFNSENGIIEMFEKAKKVKDVSKIHAFVCVDGKCKTWLYEGEMLYNYKMLITVCSVLIELKDL